MSIYCKTHNYNNRRFAQHNFYNYIPHEAVAVLGFEQTFPAWHPPATPSAVQAGIPKTMKCLL